MGLGEYKRKRDFKKTAEPVGAAEARGRKTRANRFVIQKHDASHVHYDFRLEMDGVLKSWAVPKGPSLNPQDKRLAMMVEDHPYDYRTFEGTIPEGNYGAGTVMVWDEGIYEALGYERESIKDQEKILLQELKKGDLKFVLHGEKVKGAYALVKIKGRAENAWLLIKKKDDEASKTDITKKDRSVLTNRNLRQIAEETGGKIKEKKSLVKKRPKPELLSHDRVREV